MSVSAPSAARSRSPTDLWPGSNTLDFLTANDGAGANPAGFRAKLSGSARRQVSANTLLTAGRTNYYFRTGFLLGGAPGLTSLRLRTIVADGAVFYLNGTEVLRWNMPVGSVNSSTLAVTNVPNPNWLGPFDLPNTALVSGTNVLAVELHSAAGGTSNVLFGAELALTTTNLLVPPPFPLAINEVSSATNADFWIEFINHGPNPLNLSGCYLTRQNGSNNAQFIFPFQALAPGAFFSVSRAALGFGAVPGDRLFLYGGGGTRVLDASVAGNEARGRWPDGTGRWWFPTTLTPGESNHFVFQDQVVINEVMYHPAALPAQPAVYGTNILISITNVWKYHGLGADLGSTWRGTGYDDTTWPAGQALCYNTTSMLPAPKNTELPLTNAAGARIITWYFRAPFVFLSETNGTQLTLNSIIDDGAVYYLNGAEIHRQNMPGGEISYATLSAGGVATPAFSGPFTVGVTNLFPGTNLLAVEVHQFTTNPIAADIAFGVEVSAFSQQTPPLPARESPDSWVELFNRGTNAVDLTGWRLDEGIDFRFAPGTGIAAGGYLVVAKDVPHFQSNHPGVAVAGPYTNRLSHRDDYLVLKDAANNPADEVHYFDGGRWPEYPGGGGSSLELRDPFADNAKAEAWAASNESPKSGWSNYTYRAVAQNVLGPTQWREFVMGLLDAGECLIDDLHVVESPGTVPVEMLQNGTFETGLTAWRALGDHGKSRVEVDPDSPGNHVLHLVATGPTEHMHNHLETTLAGGRAVVDGREYQVSFRAKWLAGNNRLNTRLYFNRSARTTVLPLPALHGTPGARNSAFAGNTGPNFDDFKHSPVVPQVNQPVTVSVNVHDPQGVSTAAVWWSVNGGAWQSTPMTPTASAAAPGYVNYAATLAGRSSGTLVQFYVQAADGLGASGMFPARGTNSRAFYKVDEGKPLMTRLHRLRLLMTSAETAFLHASTNVMSNDQLGLTVVYDENEVFYDVGVHLQGSERGRDNSGRVGFTVRFNEDQLFRGTQKNFAIDRSGGYSGLGGRHDEILLWHAANHAGGLLGIECDLVQVFAPRSQEDGTGMMRMAAFDDDYFAGQFQNGDEGNHYMQELIYFPTTTATGDPQAPKLPQPDDVINTDIQNWGDDQENYRWIFVQENQANLDDYSRIIALNKAFSLTGAALDAQTRQLMDVDNWMRTLAFKAFLGDADTYTAGYGHNWKLYFRPQDGRALGLLWDMDFSFYQPVTTAFPGTASPNTYRIIMLPDNYRRYCNHLLDILTTTVSSAHLSPWASRYAGMLGQDWSGAVNYLQQRANYIRGTLPLSTVFAITSNGGNNFATSNSPVSLAGTAPLTVKGIEVNGVSYPITWTSVTDWTLRIPLPGYTNFIALQGVDNYGNRLANATDSIVITNLGVPAPRPVVINEWMADNQGPGGFADPLDGRFQDWFELYNPNDFAVDLSGYHLTDLLSDPGRWTVPTNTFIGPRGFLLVWADNQTAQNGLSPYGDLHTNFQLSNEAEAIGLYSQEGTLQHSVVFGLQAQNISQGCFPDGTTNAVHNLTNWTPRASNRLGAPPPPQASGVSVRADGSLEFQVSAIPGRTYRVEYKNQLNDTGWTPLGVDIVASAPWITIVDDMAGRSQRFYRVGMLQ